MTMPKPRENASLDRVAQRVVYLGVYALQGMVVAYFYTFLQGYLRAWGLTDEGRINGIQSVALTPFIFKFVMGPVSDRLELGRLGRRIPYVVLGLAALALGLFGLSRVDPTISLTGFMALATLAVAGLAVADTVTDGLILETTPAEGRATLQGQLASCRFVATTIALVGFGFWFDWRGQGPGGGDFALVFLALATGVVLALVPILAREPSRQSSSSSKGDTMWQALGSLLKPGSLAVLAFGAWYALMGQGVEINLSNDYTARGWSDVTIGWLAATRYAGRAMGALAMPAIRSRLPGEDRSLTAAALLGVGVALAGAGFAFGLGPAFAGAFLVGTGLGFADATFFYLAMERSDPRMAASTFALFMAVTNLSVLGGSVFDAIRSAVGGSYAITHILMGGMTPLALVVIRWIEPRAGDNPTRMETTRP